jgi:hypothetical protein
MSPHRSPSVTEAPDEEPRRSNLLPDGYLMDDVDFHTTFNVPASAPAGHRLSTEPASFNELVAQPFVPAVPMLRAADLPSLDVPVLPPSSFTARIPGESSLYHINSRLTIAQLLFHCHLPHLKAKHVSLTSLSEPRMRASIPHVRSLVDAIGSAA